MTAAQEKKVQFQIQQLRMDKIIHAVDALAICFAVFLTLLSLPVLFAYVPNLPPQTSLVLLIIAVGSVIWALVGNLRRFKEIKQLEKDLA